VGDLAEAEADYQRAAELARRAGAQAVLAEADSGLGDVARLRGDLAQARRRCEKALAECPAGWYVADETRAYILVALGRIAEAGQDAGQARTWYRRALGVGHGAAPDAAEGLAGVALLEGDGERAALLLGAGTALRGTAVAGDPDVARVSAAARARVGPAAYERAYRQGAAMPRDQALTLIGAPPSASGA
jgi:tetratricopeptide (TPR) repeat protein